MDLFEICKKRGVSIFFQTFTIETGWEATALGEVKPVGEKATVPS